MKRTIDQASQQLRFAFLEHGGHLQRRGDTQWRPPLCPVFTWTPAVSVLRLIVMHAITTAV